MRKILIKYLDAFSTSMKISMIPAIIITGSYNWKFQTATVWQVLGVMFLSLIFLTLILGYILAELKDYFRR